MLTAMASAFAQSRIGVTFAQKTGHPGTGNCAIDPKGDTLDQSQTNFAFLRGPVDFGIDTADLVSGLISRFLVDGRFEAYVADQRNYERLL